MNTKAKLAKIIRDARLNANMTQAELSTRLGYGTAQFVSLIEREQSKVPLDTLGKCIKLFSLDQNEIVDLIVADQRAIIVRELNRGAMELNK